ncbi:MAG TPA: FKBP-type peptidyl-prolyl cis-trans isomerase [Polyangia bacterium]|jgi:peptidylprolyl isomerase
MRRHGWTLASTIPCSVALFALLATGSSCDKKESAPPAPPAPPAAPTPPPPPAPPPPPPRSPDDLPPPDDVKAPPADAKKTDSGLAYKVLTPGKGKQKPALADTVEVHYTGWTTDGRMFDSSVKRGQPAHFPVGGVIKGWTEGLQLMTVGEKARFWIPANLAYGDTPGGGRPAGMLVFDVELLGIIKAPEPPKTPEDVAAPPKSAKKTASGIAYRVLKKGTGKEHPTADSTVEVHYSGWTTDGKMFDSSVTRGQPATFPLRGVIPGWTEGVQLMTVGEKIRFWIPGNLAYDNSPRPGAPHGTLVFDIELLSIK